MPDQNNPTQNPNPVTPPADAPIAPPVPPIISPQTDLPPLSPDFQKLPEDGTSAAPPANGGDGSAAPPDISSVIPKAKKKFGGGKIIATILGLIVLVGGVGAGIVLTQQQQLFQQKASDNTCSNPNPSCKCSPADESHCQGTFFTKGCTETTDGSACDITCAGVKSCSDDNGADKCDNSSAAACKGVDVGYVVDSNWTGECPGGKPTCSNGIQLVCKISSGTSCNANCKCNAAPPSPSSTPLVEDGCIFDNFETKCSNGQMCDVPKGEYGFAESKCSGVNAPDTGDKCSTYGSQYYCIPGGYCIRNSTCQPNDVAVKNCHEDSSCSPTNPPSGSPTAPSCIAVKAYDSAWAALTNTQLSALTTGDLVNFCVSGNASGTFDKAQFMINTTLGPETTTKRPSSKDFCQSYTILSTDTTVNVKAKIHSTTGVWVGESI
jgi:hypothetical protein